ncbi:hypothetical protein EJB05_49513, partial [Eragrostis curvula]
DRIARTSHNLPPGPRPLPLLGNLLDIGSDLPHRAFTRLAQRHGSLMSVRLGTTRVIVASSASAAREILQKHSAHVTCGNWTDAWRGGGFGANSLFSFQPLHKRRALRRLGMETLFSARRLDDLLQLRHDAVNGFLRDVSEHAASRTPVSVGRAAFAAMVTLLCRAMFSDELDGALSREIQDGVREAVVLVSAPNVSDFFPAIAGADLQGLRRRMGRLIARIFQILDRTIEQRVHSRDKAARTHDLVDVMLDMAQKEPGDGDLTMNRDVMRTFCVDMLAGASDTTSNTIEWALADLLKNPQAMRKLQDELKLVLGSKYLTLTNFLILQAVIKETLRLHSLIPLIGYRAETTIEVQGYSIPKGSNIVVNVWAIHHDADFWSHPDMFIPERFLHRNFDFLGRDFNFIPFGSGRQVCLGLPLANRMVPIMLGSLIHQFEWTLPNGVTRDRINMTEKFGLVLSMANPIHAIAKKK